jgi:hypothetical protein
MTNARALHWMLVSLLIVALGGCATQEKRSDTDDRIPVTSLDDLPRHTYPIAGSATEMLQSEPDMMMLAAAVKADIHDVLDKYRIEDNTTLRRYHGVLLTIAMIEGDDDTALKKVIYLRSLEDKEAARLLAGLLTEAMITARREAGADDARYQQLVGAHLKTRLAEMPWDVVGDDIEQSKGRAEIMSRNLVMGIVSTRLDPVVEQLGGEVSADIAWQLIGMYYSLNHVMPLKPVLVQTYGDIVAAHRVEKADIWAARDVELPATEPCTPVVVAIWDSGVDTDIFTGQLWRNANERPDGADDDDNGYVDDIHGIAYDLQSDPTPQLLHPLDEMHHDAGRAAGHMKGFMDLQAAIDSPEAMGVKQALGQLNPQDVQPFIEDLMLYGNYSHGTHVAGIAAAGNPFIRMLVARLTFDYRMIPQKPTMELAHKGAAAAQATIDYFNRHGVRVVNMSWGTDRASLEGALEANGVKDAEERAELARQMYKVQRDGLYAAMKGAPDILFVTSAGNSDNDVQFDEMIPSGFDLPNLLVVGAVDQAGDPTDFTSFGKTVEVYANGFEVDSYVPGGKRMKFSGTSMSSPNVVNLAAKILAIDPTLRPTEVIELIRAGADRRAGDPPMLLINPARTIELVKK